MSTNATGTKRRKIVVGITGASGAPYAKPLLAYLTRRVREVGDVEVGVCLSATAPEVWALECGGDLREHIELPVYRMRPVGSSHAPEADVVIVTSPEHASALHAVKPLHTFAHRIAMGTSTAQRIRELSGADAIIPWASNEMALVDAVFNIATA